LHDKLLKLSQLEKYLKLDQKGAVIAEYVWIDSSGMTRSKSKVGTVPVYKDP